MYSHDSRGVCMTKGTRYSIPDPSTVFPKWVFQVYKGAPPDWGQEENVDTSQNRFAFYYPLPISGREAYTHLWMREELSLRAGNDDRTLTMGGSFYRRSRTLHWLITITITVNL